MKEQGTYHLGILKYEEPFFVSEYLRQVTYVTSKSIHSFK